MFLISEDTYSISDTSYKGRGVFALREIPPGTVIGDYLGTLMRPEDEDEEADGLYTFGLDETHDVLPNPKVPGVHLINHSCMANCDVYLFQGHALYVAVRRIFEGEELTVDYMLDSPEDEKTPCPHVCKCGSLLCRGTMHSSTETTNRWDAYFSKKKKGVFGAYGTLLPPLREYPSHIPDVSVWDIYAHAEKKPLILEDDTLPSEKKIRERIRESGRPLRFPAIRLTVFGIADGILIGHPHKKK